VDGRALFDVRKAQIELSEADRGHVEVQLGRTRYVLLHPSLKTTQDASLN